MINRKYILTVLTMAMVAPAAMMVSPSMVQAQQTLGIAAVVNDDAISMRDVEERVRLVMVSSGLPNNPEIRARIMPQIMESLIEEQLKMQEARRRNLSVSDEEMEEGLGTIAQQNKFTADQFRQIMKQQGVPVTTLERQIRAQLAWNKVVRDVHRRQVDVSAKDVDSRIARMKAQIGKTEYLVSEIYLPIDNSKRADEVQKFATRMAQELQAGKAPFGPVAAQFSKAAGADKGGLLGWIQEGHLAPDLEKIVLKLEERGVSNPVRSGNGIYLFKLNKKRVVTEESIPPREELTNQIGFERLDRVQQKALLDLKSSAFIDRRV